MTENGIAASMLVVSRVFCDFTFPIPDYLSFSILNMICMTYTIFTLAHLHNLRFNQPGCEEVPTCPIALAVDIAVKYGIDE